MSNEQDQAADNYQNENLDMFQQSLQALRDLTQVQCSNGNWNYDPYMHGMANGMIFALSLFESGEPAYLEAPKVWLKDIPSPNILTEQSSTLE